MDEPKKPRFNQEQYDMLLRCSEKKDMTEWNKWREKNQNVEIELEGADFMLANLENANLIGAHLENAIFIGAHLEKAHFIEANLENADLIGAHLENANLFDAHLENVNFRLVSVDGNTSITKCSINGNTDFRGVGLDNIRIDSGIKGLLQYNIRRLNWEDWYKEHKVLHYPVKWFFDISDYGISTTDILWVFLGFTIFFSVIYESAGIFCYPGIVENLFEAYPGTPPYWAMVLRPLYFSIVTMTTLGFGDMSAEPNSIAGHIILSIQVILGYVLLGSIVTRLGILFTADGPIDKTKFTNYEGNFLERFFKKFRNRKVRQGE